MDYLNNIADFVQIIGRVHRVGSSKPQTVDIVTLDGTYDMFMQYRVANKSLSFICGTADIPLPAGHENWSEEDLTDYMYTEADKLVQRILGQRCSRLRCGYLDVPFSFEECPPDAFYTDEQKADMNWTRKSSSHSFFYFQATAKPRNTWPVKYLASYSFAGQVF